MDNFFLYSGIVLWIIIILHTILEFLGRREADRFRKAEKELDNIKERNRLKNL